MTILERIESLAADCRTLARVEDGELGMGAFDWLETAKALDAAAKMQKGKMGG